VPKQCDVLNYPELETGTLAFPVWKMTQEVRAALQESEESESEAFGSGSEVDTSFNVSFPAPKPVMMVAAGACLEAILGFLTVGNPRNALDSCRLGAGDAVLLKSTSLFRLIGEDGNEHVRSDSELWEVALKRTKWKVERHIRGDGFGAAPGGLPPTIQETQKAQEAKLKSGVKKDPVFDLDVDPDDDDAPIPEVGDTNRNQFSETRRSYRSYAGEPMIFTHSDFNRLVKRAGSVEFPLDRATTQKIKPLVHGLRPKSEARRERFERQQIER